MPDPFAPETTPAAVHVAVDQYTLTPLARVPDSAAPAVVLGSNAIRRAAVWLPAGHHQGHGLPKLGVVLGEKGPVPPDVRMVVGLSYAAPALADMVTRLAGGEMRLVLYTRDDVPAYPVDGPVRSISIGSMRHEVTHQLDDGYVSLFSSTLEDPQVAAVTPR